MWTARPLHLPLRGRREAKVCTPTDARLQRPIVPMRRFVESAQEKSKTQCHDTRAPPGPKGISGPLAAAVPNRTRQKGAPGTAHGLLRPPPHAPRSAGTRNHQAAPAPKTTPAAGPQAPSRADPGPPTPPHVHQQPSPPMYLT